MGNQTDVVFLCTELENHKFFAKPKLALDCVGGVSASRLAETLQDGCELVCFGCVTGKPVTVPWTGLVGRGLVVRGFSLRKWMAANKKKVRYQSFNHSINTSIRPRARADLTVHAGAQDVGDAGQAGQRG